MTGLDLSGNNLSGPLPAGINQQLPLLTSLDLSNNGFSGEIPGDIGNFMLDSYLNTHNLQHNRFTGQIPEQIGTFARLSSFSVADNSLSGPIPGSLQRFAPEYFAGNGGLCGAPLDRKCKRGVSMCGYISGCARSTARPASAPQSASSWGSWWRSTSRTGSSSVGVSGPSSVYMCA
ncbi:hypothetical protein SEVIR_5G415600v4 [Setaria viridis]|uniref:Leucine-rich repeat-containing N-terminal plant-type domain-containing protein n=1 Tax=Setaria viridis TaxID=4556 RepID=A0A4U6US42_SETVI|nr:hypothetical protein SEVIR_5G415600v2 [Setaria viridis]